MGLFSFLTGQKDEPRLADAPKPKTGGGAATAAADAPKPVTGGGESSASRPAADPGETRRSAQPETPFTPPEAWNTEALTAPAPEASGEAPQVGPMDPPTTAELQGPIIEAIKTVYDPEIPVDIYELGLIYDIVADADRKVLVKMTLTSPACPSAQQIPSEVRYKVKALPGVTDAWVDIVWDPPWSKDRMSEEARLALGIY